MFKHFSLKLISFAMLLTASSSFARAEGVLDQLPFGIKVGVTTNLEIENRGICIKRIQVSDSYYRCELYDIADGKFQVYSSQNEIVSKVYFGGDKSSLPQKWKDIGIKLSPLGTGVNGPHEEVRGKRVKEFIEIIKLNNAKNVTTSTEKITGDGINYIHIGTFVAFDVGIHSFIARFDHHYNYKNWYDGQYRKGMDANGMTGLSITEAY